MKRLCLFLCLILSLSASGFAQGWGGQAEAQPSIPAPWGLIFGGANDSTSCRIYMSAPSTLAISAGCTLTGLTGSGGITTLNTLTGATQTFGTPGTTGTAPTWTSSGTAHTLNIPMASATNVTAGLLNKTDYDIFAAKQAAITVLGSAYGGTANGFTKFTGPTTPEKTFTLPNASATILTTNDLVTLAQGGTAADLHGVASRCVHTNAAGTALELMGGDCGVAGGTGLTSLNGLTGASQTFSVGSTGTAPAIVSAGTDHAFNFPMAATASVTAGLLSKTDYDSFAAKLSSVTAHALLSTTHSDTTAGAVVRGDIITGQGASAKWAQLAKGTQYQVLTGGANEPAWSALALDQATATSGILGSAKGGTGNGFAKFSGPTTAEKTFALPDASSTIVTGTGTTNTLPKTTGAGTQGDSLITDDATTLNYTGTGGITAPQFASISTALGQMRLYEAAANGTNFRAFTGPSAQTGDVSWELPDSDAAGVFTSNGSGKMSVSTTIPNRIALANDTNKTAAITPTTIYAVPSTGAGLYRVSFVAVINTAATVSSTLGGAGSFQLTYADGDTWNVITTPTGLPYNATPTSLALNTTQVVQSGSLLVNCRASTNLQYSYGYTSSGATSMVYYLHTTVEEIQ